MKYVLLSLSLIFCIGFLTSCGWESDQESDTPPVQTQSWTTQTPWPSEETPEPSQETPSEEYSENMYIGLTPDEANAKAEENGVKFRVIEEDGQPLPATKDLRPWRINATVLDGKVTFVEIEGQETVYDALSWKSIIPESCMNFSDGCNTCVRNPENGVVACTQRACIKYERPRCLDSEVSSWQESDTPTEDEQENAQ